jgi:hypothetical protein
MDDQKTIAAEMNSETLHEHLELSHYIDVFRGSAEYVRRVIFVMLVFSVLILIAQWNTTSASWIPRRSKSLRALDVRASALNDKTAADALVALETNQRYLTLEDLQTNVHEYTKQRIERVVLVEIPGLGVTFDVNDLGNFCGIAYALILIFLVLALVREHENLVLALFKVGRLHERDGEKKGDGESRANYLYHALAMSQVLNSPPTLAQWAQPAIKRVLLNVVLFIPVVVETYIVVTNFMTMDVLHFYHASPMVMGPQVILLAVNLGLTWIAHRYAQSCDHRWNSAFFLVNPALRAVAAPPWRVWVKRPAALHATEVQDHHLRTQLVAKLKLAHEQRAGSVPVTHAEVVHSAGTISHSEIHRMCTAMEAKAVEDAADEQGQRHVFNGQITSSVLDGKDWLVTAVFDVGGSRTETTPRMPMKRDTQAQLRTAKRHPASKRPNG